MYESNEYKLNINKHFITLYTDIHNDLANIHVFYFLSFGQQNITTLVLKLQTECRNTKCTECATLHLTLTLVTFAAIGQGYSLQYLEHPS